MAATFGSLPPEITVTVFKNLSTKHLARAAQVCKSWNGLAKIAQLIFVPTPTAFKGKSRFLPVSLADNVADFVVSETATAIVTQNRVNKYLTVVSSDSKKTYSKSFSKQHEKFETVAWLGPNLLAMQHTDKTMIRDVSKKKQKTTKRALDEEEERVISSCSSSFGGLAFTRDDSIAVYRLRKKSSMDLPKLSEARRLVVLDNCVLALLRQAVKLKKMKKPEIHNKIVAYPLNDKKMQVEFFLSKGEQDEVQVFSDNDWIVVQEENKFIVIPLNEKKKKSEDLSQSAPIHSNLRNKRKARKDTSENLSIRKKDNESKKHEIHFDGKIEHIVFQNHLLIAVIKKNSKQYLITWNARGGEVVSRIPLKSGYKHMHASQNIAAVVYEDEIKFFRVTDKKERWTRDLTTKDLPKLSSDAESGEGDSSDLSSSDSSKDIPKEVFQSIYLWNEEKIHIMTSRGLYTWNEGL